jgi:hypothetical protein
MKASSTLILALAEPRATPATVTTVIRGRRGFIVALLRKGCRHFPSASDHFPDVQSNTVPLYVSMGAYNCPALSR